LNGTLGAFQLQGMFEEVQSSGIGTGVGATFPATSHWGPRKGSSLIASVTESIDT
jgi:hypothetical protein